MCGRFFIDAKNREIDRLLEKLPQNSPPVKLGEVYPTDFALTLILKNCNIIPQVMAWGFPGYKGKNVVFNARSETALEKPMFKNALLEHPAIIPVCGFYEWQKIHDKKHKNKFLFTNPTSSLLYLAGMWKYFYQENGQGEDHFTILTTAANGSSKFCHDRMPVLLQESEFMAWLEGKNTKEILNRIPFAVQGINTTA